LFAKFLYYLREIRPTRHQTAVSLRLLHGFV
jgi:hypothetical protein